MDSYVIQVNCSHCGMSWSKKVQVARENVQNEVISFLTEVTRDHQHETMGSLQVTWEFTD